MPLVSHMVSSTSSAVIIHKWHELVWRQLQEMLHAAPEPLGDLHLLNLLAATVSVAILTVCCQVLS
jgi:hypothetical protein